MIKESILECIGNTPLVHLNKIEEKEGLKSRIYAKVESFNPGLSIKDRPALKMIDEAIKEGKINKDTTIVEATSGNTGIGLALVCNYMKLKLVIVMPENATEERKKIMKCYGATLILTPKKDSISGSERYAQKLVEENDNYFLIGQFDNENNSLSHQSTAKEIIDDLPTIDILVASFGTGGTISGTSKYLKEYNKDIKVVGVEPLSSPLITKGYSNYHKIPGIGADFIPKILDLKLIDEVVDVSDEDSRIYTRELLQEESILAGISSGAALKAAIDIAKEEENKDIVVILPDTGTRYMSIKGVYTDE